MKLKAILVKVGKEDIWYRVIGNQTPNTIHVSEIYCETSYEAIDWSQGFTVVFALGPKKLVINPRFVWSAELWNTETSS